MMLIKLIVKLKNFIFDLPNKFPSTTDQSWMLVLLLHFFGLFAAWLISPSLSSQLSLTHLSNFFGFMLFSVVLPFFPILMNSYTIKLLSWVKKALLVFLGYIQNTFFSEPLTASEIAYNKALKEFQKKQPKAVEVVAKVQEVSPERLKIRAEIEHNMAIIAKRVAEEEVAKQKRLTKFFSQFSDNPETYVFTPVSNKLGAKKKLTNIEVIVKYIKEKAKSFKNEIFGVSDTASVSQGQSYASDFVLPSSAEARSIFELYHSVNLMLLSIAFILVILALSSSVEFIKKLLGRDKMVDNTLEILRNRRMKRLLFIKNIRWNETKTLGEQFSFINFICDERNFNRYLTTTAGSVFWVYHSRLEFIWTLLPCIVLLFISLPSFTLALALDEAHKPTDWIKVVGNQWFWVYEYSAYVDNSVVFSNIVQGSDMNERGLRVLAVDNCVTIKQNKFTRLLITSADVIHSWCVPALGIKVDACPGRINAVTVLPGRAGVFYGQCSEICGVNHGFMPICVEVVM